MANKALNEAYARRYDEFYTLYDDVQDELQHYSAHFKGKIVYCNCDMPVYSNFYRYFKDNFHELGLKKLVATYLIDYEAYPFGTYKWGYDGVTEQANLIHGDGDFRSEACLELLSCCDIVVTNPPFSLFRQYMQVMMDYGCKFLILGPFNACTYRDVFPLFKDNKIWLGGTGKELLFEVPKEHKQWLLEHKQEGSAYRIRGGRVLAKLCSCCWITNLDNSQRHQWLELTAHYDPSKYTRYINYDAINVDRLKDIPADYDGVMGVPITFLGKYNPNQFEIVAFRYGNDGRDLMINKGGEVKQTYTRMLIKNTSAVGLLTGDAYTICTDGKSRYARVGIKHK